jgi:peptide/nickel transport system substrate-binding protein
MTRRFLFPLAALLVLALACGKREKGLEPVREIPKDQDTPATGDTLVEGSIGDASNLIWLLASDSASHQVAALSYNALLGYDGTLNVYGDLADRWEVSPDGLQMTFHLRKGVKWRDGTPLTADDVLFTYRLIIDPKTPTAYSEDYKQVSRAEAPDPYTVRFTYDKPFAPAFSSWAGFSVLPKHLLEGKDVTKSPLTRTTMGTGPFQLKEWKTQTRIEMVSNRDYFMGRPWIDRTITRIIPDMATQFLELKSGGLDEMGLTPTQWARQTNTPAFNGAFQKFQFYVNAFTYLGLNHKDPRFADRRVRQAIAYAIDRKEIVKGVLLGLGEPGVGTYVPHTKWCNEGLKPYPYDPARAKMLLAEAGWQDTNGDMILDKDGKPFKFEILTNNGNEERKKTAVIIQRRLKEIGIDATIRPLEWAALINDFIDKKRFEGVVLGWQIGIDPDQFDIWHSSKTKPKELNFISYRNPEVDTLLEQGRRTFDEAKRRRIYNRLQEVMREDQPVIFLYVPYGLVAVHKRIHGIQPTPRGISDRWWNRWYVPKPLQRPSIQR